MRKYLRGLVVLSELSKDKEGKLEHTSMWEATEDLYDYLIFKFVGGTRRGHRFGEHFVQFFGEELALKEIQFGSPGYIKVEGIALVLKEVRELIKDLAYRIRQEKRAGEIKIAEDELRLKVNKRLVKEFEKRPDKSMIIQGLVGNYVEAIAQKGQDGRFVDMELDEPSSEN